MVGSFAGRPPRLASVGEQRAPLSFAGRPPRLASVGEQRAPLSFAGRPPRLASVGEQRAPLSLLSAPAYAPSYVAGGGYAAPAVAAAPTYAAPAQAQGAPMQTLSNFFSQAMSALGQMFSKLVAWVKGLFSGTQTVPGETLPADEAALAQRYGLQASRANIAAFRAEVAQYQTNGTLGPGVNNPDAVKQLQLALGRLGYPVQATGQYDQATVQGLIKFKMDAGLHQSYRSADGNFAVNEYATPDVVAALIERLRKALGQ